MCFLAESPDMKIIDEGRLFRRKVADAVDVLRSHLNFSEDIRPTISVGPLRLPSGDVPFLVLLACAELGWAVTLPSSKRFRANFVHQPMASKVGGWDIRLLGGAIVEMVEGQAHVIQAGKRMHGVEVIPYRMPAHGDRQRDVKSMKIQSAVIQHVVRMCNDDRCYRYLQTDADKDTQNELDKDQDLLPILRVIDFNMLHVLELPSLSDLMHDIQLNNEKLNHISRQTVANILRDWGIRLPQSRAA